MDTDTSLDPPPQAAPPRTLPLGREKLRQKVTRWRAQLWEGCPLLARHAPEREMGTHTYNTHTQPPVRRHRKTQLFTKCV